MMMKTFNFLMAACAVFALGCADGRGQVEETKTSKTASALDLNGDGIPDQIDRCPGEVLDPANTTMLVDGDGAPFSCETYMECFSQTSPEVLVDGTIAQTIEFLTPEGVKVGLATPMCMAHPDAGGATVCVLPTDTDGKAGPNQCDPDNDGDGHLDEVDNCPNVANTEQTNTDNTNDGGNACDSDDDNDGVLDVDDNCPYAPNPGQEDTDGDGQGDACVNDNDGDGVLDDADNCPLNANPEQDDLDGNGEGDACDSDIDGDGDPNVSDCDDGDPEVFVGQIEICDGINNNCEAGTDEGFLDTDNDGEADCVDTDNDGDGVLDDADNCPLIVNSEQTDTDGDGQGNACDSDDDNDTVADDADNCPTIQNTDQEDYDADDIGNLCDTDCDGNGILDWNVVDEADVPIPNSWCEPLTIDEDGDGFSEAEGDCNDGDVNTNPNADETCDNIDNDCDGETDEGGDALCAAGEFCSSDVVIGFGCKPDGCSTDADCDDSDACTGIETCDVDGTCLAGTPLSCEDANNCTTDTCDPAMGCLNTVLVDGTECVDGDACNGTETCQSGVCESGTTPDCDDSNPCTLDACDSVTGCTNSVIDGCEVCTSDKDCTTGTSGACVEGVCEYCSTECCTDTDCGAGELCDGTWTCVPEPTAGTLQMQWNAAAASLGGLDELRFMVAAENAAINPIPWGAKQILAAPFADPTELGFTDVATGFAYVKSNVMLRSGGATVGYAASCPSDPDCISNGTVSYSYYDGTTWITASNVATQTNFVGGIDWVFRPGVDTDGDGVCDGDVDVVGLLTNKTVGTVCIAGPDVCPGDAADACID